MLSVIMINDFQFVAHRIIWALNIFRHITDLGVKCIGEA